MANKLANLEGSHRANRRFDRVDDLWTRYKERKDTTSQDRKAWENFMRAYERWSYKKKSGQSEPNWGQFRGKIESMIEVFEALVTEREHWATIEPVELFLKGGKRKTPDDAQEVLSKNFIRDKITSEFHELCIRPWEDRDESVRLSLFDMVMFSKGINMWENPNGVYPESVPTDRVYPDSRAGMNPKKWDTCFVEKVYTATELHNKIQDEETSAALGWNKEAVIKLLDNMGQLTDSGPEGPSGITEGKSKQFGSSSDQDLKITLVMAYVKEYEADEDGNQINLYVFVHDRHVAAESGKVEGKPGEGTAKIGFLRVHEGFAKNMAEVFSIDTHQSARSYYRCPSEGEMIYAACRFYDSSINKVIRAALRNMCLMLKSENQDQQEKLKQLESQEAVVMDPDVDVVQQRIQHDIRPVVDIVRQIMIDTDRAADLDQVSGSQNVNGRAITASEANIQLTSTSNSQKKDIRLYVIGEQRKMREMYRRFVSEDTMVEGDEGYENQKIFFRRMKEAGINPKNYAPENVLVESVFYNYGESPDVIVQKAQTRLGALRQLSTSSSPGEQQTIREIVAATSSYSEAEQFMPREPNEGFYQESLIKAGIENVMMAEPLLNRKNIHVASQDKHTIEVPMHLQDVEFRINTAIGVMNSLEQTPEENVPIVLDELTDMVVALDNQGAHIEAHIQMMEQDESMRGRAAGFRENLTGYQRQEQLIERQLTFAQQSRVQSNKERLVNDEKLRHLQAQNAETERASKEANSLDLGKSLAKTQSALDGQRRKADADILIKNQNHSLDIAKKAITDQQDIATQKSKD